MKDSYGFFTLYAKLDKELKKPTQCYNLNFGSQTVNHLKTAKLLWKRMHACYKIPDERIPS